MPLAVDGVTRAAESARTVISEQPGHPQFKIDTGTFCAERIRLQRRKYLSHPRMARLPPGTKSFAITLFDRDEHGTPSGWWHWVIYDLPADVHRLPKGAGVEKSAAIPPGAVQGRNDDSEDAYAGPCPDPGDPPHRYVFTLYALSVANLPVPAEASGAMVTYTAKGYTLGKATLIGLYRQGHAKPNRQ